MYSRSFRRVVAPIFSALDCGRALPRRLDRRRMPDCSLLVLYAIGGNRLHASEATRLNRRVPVVAAAGCGELRGRDNVAESKFKITPRACVRL